MKKEQLIFAHCKDWSETVFGFASPVLELAKAIASKISKFKPTIILTQNFLDLNVDHRKFSYPSKTTRFNCWSKLR